MDEIQQLVKKARHGNVDAYGKLIGHYKEYLYRTAFLHAALIFCLAFVLFGVGFCCTHTSYASNLPIIGVIFKSLQNQTSYEDYLVKDINILDENGYGIVSVTKSKYSVWADTSLPAEGIDYFTAICDADGDLLAHQGHYAETYSIDGKDISRLFVFVCDYNEYMDELKGYYYSEDYEKKKQEKTFAQYLSEHAEYQTEVTFE